MLDSLRKAAGGVTAKILLGLLVVSFLFWGISNQFFGYGAGTVARVGDAEVTAQEFNTALRQRMLDLGRRVGRGVSLEQARAMGLPQQVLSELVSEAALDDQAMRYNLGVSGDRLARAIADDPTFRGVDGNFDRLRFQAILRNLGISEDTFVAQVRDRMMRRQIATALAGDVKAPAPMVEAYYRYANESRTVSFVVLDKSLASAIEDPDAAALGAYFEQNKARFGAPEYRILGYISLQAETVADPGAVTEADVRAEYDRRIGEFTRAERRRILQIRFDTRDEARTALDSLGAGGTFVDLLTGRGLTETDADLGLKTRAEIIDAAVAEQAFAAETGTIVPVLDSELGPAVIQVTAIEAGSVDPLEAVAERLRAEIANSRAGDAILDTYDKIEDERAGGFTLAEISERLGFDYKRIEGVARDGSMRDAATPESVPGFAAMVADAYQSDVGVENDPVRAGNEGWTFYEVLEVVPERERSLDEVREDVLAAWHQEEIAAALGERAEALADRLRAGEEMAGIAAELGAEVRVVEKLTRQDSAGPLSANARVQAFAGPIGHVANAEGESPPSRILLKVDNVVAPAFFAESSNADAISEQLARTLTSDILQAYNADLLRSRDPFINSAVYTQIVDPESTQSNP